MLDMWIVVRSQGLLPHPVISYPSFRTGGNGEARDWAAIQAGVKEVREAARAYLDGKRGSDLDLRIPYKGSITFLRPVGLSLRYAILRTAVHHMLDVGKMWTVQSLAGHSLTQLEGYQDWGRPFA